MRKVLIFVAFCFIGIASMQAQPVLKTKAGKIKFTSDAPLELIQAQSAKLSGMLRISDRSFAFSIPINSFEGFNSALQRTHFNENYMESEKYPTATFEGKIIEDVDLSLPGKYEVRGKGRFKVHGVEQVRIIKCTITVGNSKIDIASDFTVMLEDHNITIPSVVNKKIAREIQVNIAATLIQ